MVFKKGDRLGSVILEQFQGENRLRLSLILGVYAYMVITLKCREISRCLAFPQKVPLAFTYLTPVQVNVNSQL